jgi:predicted dehydrogenase
MQTIALVGAVHIHVPGFIKMLKKRSDVTVKYVWDADPDQAVRVAGELDAAATADIDGIWNNASVTSVIICSETFRHQELVLAAARAKKHVFVEKPLGMGARDSMRMVEAIESAGVLFQTGYFMRGDPALRFLKQELERGSFGRVTRVRASNCHSAALGGWFDGDYRWMADPKQAGCGAFGDLGTHMLDILLWMFGPVIRVTGQLGVGVARYPDCDEYGEALLTFKSGVIGTLAAGWVDVDNPVSLLISGTEGHATLVANQLYLKSDKFSGADGKTPWTALPPALPHAFDLFLDAISGKSVELVSVREAARATTTMESIYAAARSQTWVEPELKFA